MPDLDLPRGPLTKRLRDMHNLMAHPEAQYLTTEARDHAVAIHAHHAQAIAAYTADRPRGGPTPPRPDPIQRGEGRREGWDFLIGGPDGTVLAGWTTSGHFYAWSPTEVICRTLVDALINLHTYGAHHG